MGVIVNRPACLSSLATDKLGRGSSGTERTRSSYRSGVSEWLRAVLATFRPRSATERADLERVQELLAAGDPWARSLPLHITGSALIVHPPSRRVVLRWHARQQAWLQVGGHADPGETDPLSIALREAREETGLDDLTPWPDASLLHVVIVPVPAAQHEPAHEHADLRFALATSTPDAARPEHDAAALQWLSIDAARQLTAEDNLTETLSRVERLLDST
jgi:8-oxo-dGTP pyrophosphatase MutT (NUDIX family)